jgi:hypothetical protein
MFANLSINGKPAPSQGWQTVETAAGCHTTISFAAIDSRICDSPACVLAPPTSAAPASATCTSTAWEQQECTVGCGRLQARAVPTPAAFSRICCMACSHIRWRYVRTRRARTRNSLLRGMLAHQLRMGGRCKRAESCQKAA